MLQRSSQPRRQRRRQGRFRGRRQNQRTTIPRAISDHTTGVQKLSNISNNGDFVPQSLRTSLRIAFERNSAATGSLGNINFKGNDVFDPLGSAGSNQPVGFDYLSLLYNRFRVIGSQVSVKAIMSYAGTALTAVTASGDLVVYPTTSNINPTSLEDALAQPFARSCVPTAQVPKTIAHQMSTAAITGQPNMRSVDRLSALVNASPTDEWYWVIAFRGDAAYVDVNFNWLITITFDVEFYDRAYLGLSSLSSKALHAASQARLLELKTSQETKSTPRVERKDVDWKDESSKPIVMIGGKAYVHSNDPAYDFVSVRPPTPVKQRPK